MDINFNLLLAGFHTLNYSMFELAHGYKERMTAYGELQDAEFLAENIGYTAHGHQEVGADGLMLYL